MTDIYWKNFGEIERLKEFDPKILEHIQDFDQDFRTQDHFNWYYQQYGPFGANIMCNVDPILRSMRHMTEEKIFRGKFLDKIVKDSNYKNFHRKIFPYTNDEQKLFLLNNSPDFDIRLKAAGFLGINEKNHPRLKQSLDYAFKNFNDLDYIQEFIEELAADKMPGLSGYYIQNIARKEEKSKFFIRSIESFIEYDHPEGIRALEYYHKKHPELHRDMQKIFWQYDDYHIMRIVNPDMMQRHIEGGLETGELHIPNAENKLIIPNYEKIKEMDANALVFNELEFIKYCLGQRTTGSLELELIYSPFTIDDIGKLFNNPLRGKQPLTLSNPGKYFLKAREYLKNIHECDLWNKQEELDALAENNVMRSNAELYGSSYKVDVEEKEMWEKRKALEYQVKGTSSVPDEDFPF